MGRTKDINLRLFNINGVEVGFFGIPNSSMEVKFNRVANIASRHSRFKEEALSKINTASLESFEYRAAVAFLLIMDTGIRIGNEESAEGFMTVPVKGSDEEPRFAKTYGLTTLLPEHVKVKNDIVHLDFVGKKHVHNSFKLDREMSDLFISVYEQGLNPVFSMENDDLTRFIKNTTSRYLSSKDFRTFRANVYAYNFAKLLPEPKDKKQRKERIKLTCEVVSTKLNNTPGVIKKSYIDPKLFDYFFKTEEHFEKNKA